MKTETAIKRILDGDYPVALKISKLQTLALKTFPSSPNQKAVIAAYQKLQLKHSIRNPVPAFKRKDIEAGKRLGQRFSGHRFDKLRIARRRSPGKVRVEIGAVSGIMYLAKRDGKVEQYFHRFAAGSRPLLTVSPDGKTLELLGGAFRFTERGIVDDPRAMVKRK